MVLMERYGWFRLVPSIGQATMQLYFKWHLKPLFSQKHIFHKSFSVSKPADAAERLLFPTAGWSCLSRLVLTLTAVSAARHYNTRRVQGLFAESLHHWPLSNHKFSSRAAPHCTTDHWALPWHPVAERHPGAELKMQGSNKKGKVRCSISSSILHYSLPDLLWTALQQSYSAFIKIRCNSRSFSWKVKMEATCQGILTTSVTDFYPWSKK